MAVIKFHCWSKQTLHCPGQYINLHIPQAQRRINGEVEKDKMAGERSCLRNFNHLFWKQSPFPPPSVVVFLSINSCSLYCSSHCVYIPEGVQELNPDTFQLCKMIWNSLYCTKKYIKNVSKPVIVQFDTLSATKEKYIFTMLLKSPWILCHSWLYTVLLFKKSNDGSQLRTGGSGRKSSRLFFMDFWNSQYLKDLSWQSIKRWIIC